MGIYLYILQTCRNICTYSVSGKKGPGEKEKRGKGPENGLQQEPSEAAASTEKHKTDGVRENAVMLCK